MTEYIERTEKELEEILKQAQQALNDKKELKTNDVIKEINELAASIKMNVTFTKLGAKEKRIVKPKYRDPETDKTWTGRGISPLWMKAYIEAGRDKSEFLV